MPQFPHSTSDLRYRLIAGPIALEPLRILKCRSVVWEGWEIGFFILGASHAVTLTPDGCKERQITELLTCVPPNPTDSTAASRTLIEVPVTLEPTSSRYRFPDSAPGGMVLERFALTQGDSLRGPYAESCRLEAHFPIVESYVPLTRIGWRLSSGKLEIETVHTYPEEGCGIRSETIFSLQGAPQ